MKNRLIPEIRQENPAKVGSEVSIRPVKPADRSEIIALLNGGTAKDNIWKWQFASSSAPSIVAIDDSGKIIGFNGIMPIEITASGSVTKAVWSCDFFVSSDMRNKGIGKLLKAHLQSTYPVVLAFGISNMAERVHLASGWKRYPSPIYQTVRINSIKRPKDILLVAVQVLNRLLRYRRQSEPKIKVMLSPITLESIAELSECWTRNSKEWGAAVHRTAEYLEWRYARHPVAQYFTVAAYSAITGELQGALITRSDEHAARIVDYIGPAKNRELKEYLVARATDCFRTSALVKMTTTDPQLLGAALAAGAYQPRRANIRFSMRMGNNTNRPLAKLDWLLMSGDSDGDLLDAAKSYAVAKIERLGEDQFKAIQHEWDKLVSDSKSDTLFLGWHWVHSWWQHFRSSINCELFLLSARNQHGQLIGIAPFYRQVILGRLGIKKRRLQIIGSNWQNPDAMRSEYLCFITAEAHATEALSGFRTYLSKNREWDELIIADVPTSAKNFTETKLILSELGYLRSARFYKDTTYQIDTAGSFRNFQDRLSSSTRRRLFGNAKRLRREYGPYMVEYADEQSARHFIDELNKLHTTRWGSPVFTGAKKEFIVKVAEWCARHHTLALSRIQIDGTTVSVLLNIASGRRLYNIQSGFDQNFDPRISLGYVHLGEQIQHCFSGPYDHFDLLAGPGKNTDFKSSFATKGTQLKVLQCLRAPWLAFAYRLNDTLRKR